MSRATLVRFLIAYTLLGALAVGLPATFAPRTFYDHFPFLASWVDNLPPYNAHLTTDTGGLYLGFAVLLAWSLRREELVVPVCTAFALSQLAHTLFHFTHLDGYSTSDAVGQMASLVGLTAAPVAAIVARRPGPPGGRGSPAA